jgi:hypothetical protein
MTTCEHCNKDFDIECEGTRGNFGDEVIALCGDCLRGGSDLRDAISKWGTIDRTIETWKSQVRFSHRQGLVTIRMTAAKISEVLSWGEDGALYFTKAARGHLSDGAHAKLVKAISEKFS